MQLDRQAPIQYLIRQKAGGFNPQHPIIADDLERRSNELSTFFISIKNFTHHLESLEKHISDIQKLHEAAVTFKEKEQIITTAAQEITNAVQKINNLQKPQTKRARQEDIHSLAFQDHGTLHKRFGYKVGFEWKELWPPFQAKKKQFQTELDTIDRAANIIIGNSNKAGKADPHIIRTINEISKAIENRQSVTGYIEDIIPGTSETKYYIRRATSALRTKSLAEIKSEIEQLKTEKTDIKLKTAPYIIKYIEKSGISYEELDAINTEQSKFILNFVSENNIYIPTISEIDNHIKNKDNSEQELINIDLSGIKKEGAYPAAFGTRLTFKPQDTNTVIAILRLIGEQIWRPDVDEKSIIEQSRIWTISHIPVIGTAFNSPILKGNQGVELMNKIFEYLNIAGIQPSAPPLTHAGPITGTRIDSTQLNVINWQQAPHYRHSLDEYLRALDMGTPITDAEFLGRPWSKDLVWRGTKHPDPLITSGSKAGVAYGTPDLHYAASYAGKTLQEESHFASTSDRGTITDEQGQTYGFLHVFKPDHHTKRPGSDGFLEECFNTAAAGKESPSRGVRMKYAQTDTYPELIERFSKLSSGEGLEVPILPTDAYLGTILIRYSENSRIPNAYSNWAKVSPEIREKIIDAANSAGAFYTNARLEDVSKYMREETFRLTQAKPVGKAGIINTPVITTPANNPSKSTKTPTHALAYS